MGGSGDQRRGQETPMGSGSISSDREMLMEEIISLRRERKDLTESLTPKISCWRNQISGAATKDSIRSFHKMDSSTSKPASSFQSDSQQQQQVYLPFAVTDDFNILEDMEDLGQRMLSLSHSLSTHHAPISLYKADELVSTASKLEKISRDFYYSTEGAMDQAAAERRNQRMGARRYERAKKRMMKSWNWNKEEEGTDEEFEDMRMTREMRRAQLKMMYDYDMTTLSPLQFTHCTPGIIPPRAAVTESTLQIYSFKIVGLTEQRSWPLYVYGVVAARDSVDRNRNLLFSRSRLMRQVLTEDDPYLRLTGPSRAIVAVDYVDFEVELKVRDRDDERTDTQLMCVVNRYDGNRYEEVDDNGEHRPLLFHNPLYRAELRFERLPRTVQATILSVRFIGEEFPLKFGGQVVCVIDGAREKVVLFRSIEKKSEEDEVDLGGYVPLSRNVVSVEIGGGLDVVVEAYEGSDSRSGHFYFSTEHYYTSQGRCSVGGSEVEITVAWSLLVKDKMEMLIEGYAAQV